MPPPALAVLFTKSVETPDPMPKVLSRSYLLYFDLIKSTTF